MSLIARYKLDGNARDSEGTAHGTAIDVTWAPSQLVDGGGEARLNGTTSRIETGIQFTTETAVSLPVWFRPRQGAGYLIGQHDGTNGLAIEQTETGKIRLVVNGTASGEVTVYPGEYHHAVAVIEAGEATLYLDNEVVATVTATVTWPSVPVTIGARSDGSAALACDVVDVRGYDQALADNNIDQLNTSLDAGALDPSWIAGAVGGEVVWYSMGNISGTTLVDQMGNHDGTIVGAMQVDTPSGKALEFDGVNDYVDCGQMLGFVTQGVPFTVYTRFQLLDPSRKRVEFVFGNTLSNNNAGFSLFTDNRQLSGANSTITTERLRCMLSSGDGDNLFQPSIQQVDRSGEIVLALRSDGATVEFLVGDQVVVSEAIPPTAAMEHNVSAGEWLRPSPWGSGWAKMRWHEMRAFDRRLSDQEVETLNAGAAVSRFPYPTVRHTFNDVPAAGWNSHPTPVPNPTAIPRSGRSIVQGVTVLLTPPAWFDQRDGSGGSHLSPAGVVSRPDRQGRLSGNTTDQNGQPVSRRVRCFERRTGRIVRETWSNAAGYYQFDDLDPGKRFTVVAHDYSGTYNAVIADNAQPEVPA